MSQLTLASQITTAFVHDISAAYGCRPEMCLEAGTLLLVGISPTHIESTMLFAASPSLSLLSTTFGYHSLVAASGVQECMYIFVRTNHVLHSLHTSQRLELGNLSVELINSNNLCKLPPGHDIRLQLGLQTYQFL